MPTRGFTLTGFPSFEFVSTNENGEGYWFLDHVLSQIVDNRNKDIERKIPGIKQVIFNRTKGYTTILWTDGTSTVVHCGEGDSFERYYGFCAAVIKKLFGSTGAAKRTIDKYDLDLEKERKASERQKKIDKQLAMEQANRERKANKIQNNLRVDDVDFSNLGKYDTKSSVKELIDNLAGGDTDGD